MGDAQTPVAYEFAGFRLEPARRALTRPDGTRGPLERQAVRHARLSRRTRRRARRPRRAAARRLAEARHRGQQPQPSHRDAAPHPRRAARRDGGRPRLSVRDAGAARAAVGAAYAERARAIDDADRVAADRSRTDDRLVRRRYPTMALALARGRGFRRWLRLRSRCSPLLHRRTTSNETRRKRPSACSH